MNNTRSNIITILTCLFFSILVNIPLLAENVRSFEAAKSVTEIRPQDQRRVWTFTHRGEEIGHLLTVVKGVERINERQATVIFDSLFIDFSKIGSGATLSAWGKQYLSSMGAYLGTDLSLAGDSSIEELSLRLESDPDRKVIAGHFTRDGRKLNRTVPITKDLFGWDIHLLDQLELWLSMQSFKVGDTLQDTLFSPQSLLTIPVYGVVDKFMNREIYRNRFDSVFVIELEQPQPLQLTFSPRNELVRVDFKPQEIRAYLDYVGIPTATQTSQQIVSPSITLGLILRWLVLLTMGLFTLLLLALKGKKSLDTWLGLVLGSALSVLVLLLMSPIQSWLMDTLLTGDAVNTGSFYFLWLIPVLIFALFQEGFKAAGIYLSMLWRNPKEYLFTSLGAAFGVGFALVETGYQSYTQPITSIFDWNLMGHIFMILFHGAAGSLVGWAILKGARSIYFVVGLALVINCLIHYLPAFVLKGVAEQQLIHLMIALISALYFMGSLVILRRKS